jgi:hypothetical protein
MQLPIVGRVHTQFIFLLDAFLTDLHEIRGEDGRALSL